MPYELRSKYTKRHSIPVIGTEPEIEPTPWLASLLRTGRIATDKPDMHTGLTDEMRAQLPSILRVKKRGGSIPDILHGLFISPRMKEKLEELEPGRHGFFPIQVKSDNDKKDFGQYFQLHLHHKPDVIDFEHTLFYRPDPEGGPQYGLDGASDSSDYTPKTVYWNGPRPRGKEGPLIAFKPGALDGLHLWRGTVGPYVDRWVVVPAGKSIKYPELTFFRDPLSRKIYCSDEFANFLKTEKILGWEAIKILEKPPGWFFEARDKGWVR